jgi:hypothetical protein
VTACFKSNFSVLSLSYLNRKILVALCLGYFIRSMLSVHVRQSLMNMMKEQKCIYFSQNMCTYVIKFAKFSSPWRLL